MHGCFSARRCAQFLCGAFISDVFGFSNRVHPLKESVLVLLRHRLISFMLFPNSALLVTADVSLADLF